MKKNNLLKIMGIIFLVYVLLTWIIPTGYYSNGAYVEGDIVPVGLFDIIRYPIITMCSTAFMITAIVILLIGALYGVLNKTGAYQNILDKIVSSFKKQGDLFLIITIILFVILSALTALELPLFVLVPFFATVLLLLGYNKITAMISTVGAILVGNVVSIYGYNIAGINKYLTGDIHYSIIYRLILLFVITGLLVFTVLKTSKSKEKVKKEEIPFYEKVSSKKTGVGILVVSGIVLLITIVGMLNIEGFVNITFFSDIYTNLTNIKIGDYPIVKNLIGTIYQYGNWTNYELAMMLVILIFTIKCMYKVKSSEFVEGIKNGVIKMLPLAFYALIVNTVFLMLNATSTGYSIFPTIANKILSLTSGFNIITYSISVFIGSILYNDFPYLVNQLYSFVINNYDSALNVSAVVIQSIHGLVQLLVPTSVLLVLGLKYFDISYKNWLKQIIKFVLFTISVSALIIVLMILI